ncbi:hypothetical protein [Streptomyces sp. NPDC054854]
MALALPLTALVGSHPKFGEYGLYASATAVFVLTYGSYSGADIGHRLVESLVGSVIGNRRQRVRPAAARPAPSRAVP